MGQGIKDIIMSITNDRWIKVKMATFLNVLYVNESHHCI